MLAVVLCTGKWGRGVGTTSSRQWHLGDTGVLSSCLKISILLNPEGLVSQHQAPTGFGGLYLVSEVSDLCLMGETLWRWRINGTALLSPQRCKWVLAKEAPVLQDKTWPRHHSTALSAFDLMESSLFKWHHSQPTSGVKIDPLEQKCFSP